VNQFRSSEVTSSEGEGPKSLFGKILGPLPTEVEPVNQDFAIVIEKIGVNAPVIPEVTVMEKEEYFEALKKGVAHAQGTAYPDENRGNVYLFAHSDWSFWERNEYSDVFNLVRKLTEGDRIHIIYQGGDYVYEVINKETLKGFDTYPLTQRVIEPILTLQTCDPPGTSINRLVVTAKRVT